MDKVSYIKEFFFWLGSDLVAIHNKNGQGFLHSLTKNETNAIELSQSTIKMDKVSYLSGALAVGLLTLIVAIHNKNGQGFLLYYENKIERLQLQVAIHNKNGQGFLLQYRLIANRKQSLRFNP